MKFLYGVLKSHGPCSRDDFFRMADPARRYACEGSHALTQGLGMGFQMRKTHSREKLETSVTQNTSGDFLTFDGRLDNHLELAERCGFVADSCSDATIVLSLFERWSTACFAMLTGDWALALWSSGEQALYLARDHAGTRPLYFRQNDESVHWASLLESLLVVASDPGLSPEYAARYLARLPLRGLTPYKETYAVLPGHVLRVTHDGISQERHWNALTTRTVRYRNDQVYEEHFLSLFRQSVARRTSTGAPILAQLSGGMDSTSIVCMSDANRRADSPDAPLLDTISYFDDSEASLDEKRYFMATEAYRGKSGMHVDMSFSRRTFEIPPTADGIYPVPGADSFTLAQEKRLEALLEPGGYARILSGVGGDEVLGGVPDPLPELADLIAGRSYKQLWSRGVDWALLDRVPLYQLLRKAAKYHSDLRRGERGIVRSVPTWLRASQDVLRESGIERFGRIGKNVPPSRIENAWTWWAILETLPHLTPTLLSRREYLYPMLDKDLVEFLFAVPREQIVRPGQRRSLMKRALGHLLPPEVLHRQQKAYQLRAPLLALREARPKLRDLFTSSRLAELGWIEPSLLLSELDRVGSEVSSGHQMILRAVAFELWLRAREERTGQSAVVTAPNHWPIASGQYQPLSSV